DQKLRWLLQIARALDAAHRAGLVHRDVKPENVLVANDGIIKVLDFGLAKREVSAHEESGGHGIEEQAPASFKTQDGRLCGTPRYMAPEQFASGVFTPRSDQYAWGLVAYELLAGVQPSQGRFADPPRPLNEVVPGVSFAMATIVMRSLSFRPEN